ncbi:asparagine synthase (glutamine-hydrolyzing) [Micromonospora sp. DT227]|uniref:asparagine synthase (glutamine-hydrolyzing) n=1 Tax=Micromonospora sp. DT227 TaxID=3393433 RepID=UPI003CF2FEBB
MCGIAGICNFTRDLSQEHELADRMGKTLEHRGPDSDGLWLGDHVFLAFQRRAVIDLAGGGQPMVAHESGRTQSVLVYTGEIFNFVALRDELRARGHRFETQSDTEVVLRSYQEWGPACAERLRGMFAFAVWDDISQELVLIRDRFGIYPLFYSVTDAGDFVFGSETKAIFASGLVEPVVDADGMAEVLGFTPTPGRSPFRNVREVAPGEVVRFRRQGLQVTRYWNVPVHEHADDEQATVERVKEILTDSVTRQLVSDVPLCSLLSGGLDSSVITALASRGGSPTGRALMTVSMEYAYHLTSFRPDEVHADPDSTHARRVAELLGTDHTEFLLTAADLAAEDRQRAVVHAMERPVVGLDMYTSLFDLSTKVRPMATVTLAGDGADELFGGYVWFHDAYYSSGDSFPWLVASQGTEMLSGLLDRDLVGRLRLDEYTRDRYVDALREAPLTGAESPQEKRMRQLTYLGLTRYLRVVLDRRDRLGGAVAALEGRVPFVDHELVEYVYSVPWSYKSANGESKTLLRRAAEGLLPPSALQRPKSPYPVAQDPAYRARLTQQLGALVDGGSPVLSLLDADRLKAVLHEPSGGMRLGVTRTSIEAAIQLHYWLTDANVTIAV